MDAAFQGRVLGSQELHFDTCINMNVSDVTCRGLLIFVTFSRMIQPVKHKSTYHIEHCNKEVEFAKRKKKRKKDTLVNLPF